MKTMTAVEAKNSFGQLLEAALREPVAVTKNRREVAAMFCARPGRNLLGGSPESGRGGRQAGSTRRTDGAG